MTSSKTAGLQPSAGFLGEYKKWSEYLPPLLQEDPGSKLYGFQQVAMGFTFSYLEAEQIQLLTLLYRL